MANMIPIHLNDVLRNQIISNWRVWYGVWKLVWSLQNQLLKCLVWMLFKGVMGESTLPPSKHRCHKFKKIVFSIFGMEFIFETFYFNLSIFD
jgi:hypothetical protein